MLYIFYLLTNPVDVFLCKDLARRNIETRTTKVFSHRKILTTELIDVDRLNVYGDEERARLNTSQRESSTQSIACAAK